MSDEESNPIFNISVAEFGSIASQVLGTEAVAIGNVRHEKIGRSAGASTIGIYRVVGYAQTSVGEQAWSAVAKVLDVTEVSPPDALRELEVYRSGVFAELPGLRAVRCYAIYEREGMQLLWLEDLSAAPQAPWIPEYYLDAAHHLGQFNANWPEQALPEWAWLNQRRFTQQFRHESYAQAFAKLPARQAESLINRFAQPDTTRKLINWWNASEALFAQVEATSKGICHLDCHPKNLFPMASSTPHAFTIAIDWASVGVGCLGIDIGHLLGSPLTWLEISLDQASRLVEPIFEAYLGGLKQAGWTGNERQVKLAYLTRLGCEANRMTAFVLALVDNPQFRAWGEQSVGHSAEEICDRWGDALPFLLSQTDRALELASEL
jgi:hypothetical protein